MPQISLPAPVLSVVLSSPSEEPVIQLPTHGLVRWSHSIRWLLGYLNSPAPHYAPAIAFNGRSRWRTLHMPTWQALSILRLARTAEIRDGWELLDRHSVHPMQNHPKNQELP